MLGNAVWFGTLSKEGAETINLMGVVSVTWPEIIMGLLINVLTFPFVFIIVFLFKFSKPSKLRTNTIEKSLKEKEETDLSEEQENSEKSETEDDDTETDDDSMGMAEDSDVAEDDIKSMTSIGKPIKHMIDNKSMISHFIPSK